MKAFPKRTFGSLRVCIDAMVFLLMNMPRIWRMERGELIDLSFKERLMLSVSAVNRCRYCSQYHVRVGLLHGVARQELLALLRRENGKSPEHEIAALLYARHWAETRGFPDPAMTERLYGIYGREAAETIIFVIRCITIGNLLGNTLDWMLYRLSFGRWGGVKEKKDDTGQN